jgi:hypothetical protein
MFRDQLKWVINYFNNSTNIGPKFVYNETNNATKFVLTLLDAAGSLYGGIWREHPLDQIVININVVRWAITYGQIDDLRETIIHEIGHYAGLAHTNDPNCALIPGTPAEDPPSVMYDHNVIAPEYSYYDLLALKYALPNRVGLNRGLDFIPVPPGGPIDGNSWKFWDKTSFPDENYSVDEIATGGSSNIEWTYDNNPFVGALDKDCVTSGDISDNEWTWLRLRFNTARDGTQLSFSYYTDTEKNWDFFEVYVGLYRQPVTLVHRVSGFKYWNKITITLPVSDRCDVYFYYTKDGSISTGTDQVNIDHTTLSR